MKAARAKVQRRQMATNEREKDQDSKGPVKDQRRQIATDDSDEREGPGIDCFSLSGFE